jgi:hypothetical protein
MAWYEKCGGWSFIDIVECEVDGKVEQCAHREISGRDGNANPWWHWLKALDLILDEFWGTCLRKRAATWDPLWRVKTDRHAEERSNSHGMQLSVFLIHRKNAHVKRHKETTWGSWSMSPLKGRGKVVSPSRVGESMSVGTKLIWVCHTSQGPTKLRS